ncbi:MAG: hypothetical protein AB7U83_00340 [Vicinamibacterales bacterium]
MRLRFWALVAIAAAAAAGWWRWPAPPLDATTVPAVEHPVFSEGAGPAVLVDNAHWNAATSVRGLAGFAELLRRDGYRVLPDGNATRAEMLADARIAVVANPLGLSGVLRALAGNLGLPPITALDDEALWLQEMETTIQWVENGGALLVAVDEGPPARAVRGLTSRLGVQVGDGVAIDLGHSEPLAPDRLVFSRENGLIGTHPIVDGGADRQAVNRLVSVGGPSLSGPEGSVALLVLSPSAVEVPRLGVSPAAGTLVPGRARAVAFTRGRGRVVVVADTALVTGLVDGDGRPYGLGADGTQADRFARGVMRWLARLD